MKDPTRNLSGGGVGEKRVALHKAPPREGMGTGPKEKNQKCSMRNNTAKISSYSAQHEKEKKTRYITPEFVIQKIRVLQANKRRQQKTTAGGGSQPKQTVKVEKPSDQGENVGLHKNGWKNNCTEVNDCIIVLNSSSFSAESSPGPATKEFKPQLGNAQGVEKPDPTECKWAEQRQDRPERPPQLEEEVPRGHQAPRERQEREAQRSREPQAEERRQPEESGAQLGRWLPTHPNQDLGRKKRERPRRLGRRGKRPASGSPPTRPSVSQPGRQ